MNSLHGGYGPTAGGRSSVAMGLGAGVATIDAGAVVLPVLYAPAGYRIEHGRLNRSWQWGRCACCQQVSARSEAPTYSDVGK